MSIDAQRRCPKCNAAQELGFGIDATDSNPVPARWLSGPPQSSWWSGIKTEGTTCYRMEYWRCTRCGFLEAFATEKVDPPGFFRP